MYVYINKYTYTNKHTHIGLTLTQGAPATKRPLQPRLSPSPFAHHTRRSNAAGLTG